MDKELTLRKDGNRLAHKRRVRNAWMVLLIVTVGLLVLGGLFGAWYLWHRAKTSIGICFDPKLKISSSTFHDGLQIRAVKGVPEDQYGFCWELEPVYNEMARQFTSSRIKLRPCDPSNPAQLFSTVGPAARALQPPSGSSSAPGETSTGALSHWNWWHLQNSQFSAQPNAQGKNIATLAKQIACAQEGAKYGDGCSGDSAGADVGPPTSLWQLVTPCAEQQQSSEGGACPPGGKCQIRMASPSWYSTVGFQPCANDPLSPQGHYTGAAAEFAFDVRDADFPCAFEMANMNPNEDVTLPPHTKSAKATLAVADSSSDPFRQPHGNLAPTLGADGYLQWGKPGTNTWAFINPRIQMNKAVQKMKKK